MMASSLCAENEKQDTYSMIVVSIKPVNILVYLKSNYLNLFKVIYNEIFTHE